MTWEQRMADAAKERLQAEKAAQTARSVERWQAQRDYDIAHYEERHGSKMTEDEARDWLDRGTGLACACAGGPFCCIIRSAVAHSVLGLPPLEWGRDTPSTDESH